MRRKGLPFVSCPVCADDKPLLPNTTNLTPPGQWLQRDCPKGHHFWVRFGGPDSIETDPSAEQPTG